MLCVLIRVDSKFHYFIEDQKDITKLSPYASRHGSVINPRWLVLPMSTKKKKNPKNVRAIEVRLYIHGKTTFFCRYELDL